MTSLMKTSQISSINRELSEFLDTRSGGSKRKPMDVSDFQWDQLRGVDDTLLAAMGFVVLIESNPRAAAEPILAAADAGELPAIRRFIELVWLPEESMHSAPFFEYLVRSGQRKEDVIRSEMDRVRQREFTLGKGYTALMAVTYGWVQELLTWQFYTAMQRYNRSKGKDMDPVVDKILITISGQENFHRLFYLTALTSILTHMPELRLEYVRALSKFIMPHHVMTPHLPKDYAGTLGKKLGFDTPKAINEIVDQTVKLTGRSGLGQIVLGYVMNHQAQLPIKLAAAMLGPISRVPYSPVNLSVGVITEKLRGLILHPAAKETYTGVS